MAEATSSTRRKVRKIRYHDREWERVMERARACGIPPAVFVRKASLGIKLRARRNRAENEVILHLGRIGMDLQRLTRSFEQTGDLLLREELHSVLEEVLAAVRRVG